MEGRCPRGSDANKNFTVKELSDIFYNVESTKDKKLEVDPDLERHMTIF